MGSDDAHGTCRPARRTLRASRRPRALGRAEAAVAVASVGSWTDIDEGAGRDGLPRRLLPAAARRLVRRPACLLLLPEHFGPVVHDLGRLPQRLQVAPHPILPGHVDHPGAILVQLLHELRRVGLGVLQHLDHVDPVLGVQHAAALTRRPARTRCHHHGIGERRVDPAERAEFPVRQLHRLGRGGHAMPPVVEPLQVVLAPSLDEPAHLLVVPRARTPRPAGSAPAAARLPAGGCRAGTRRRRTRSRSPDWCAPGLAAEGPDAGVGHHQVADLDPGAFLDRRRFARSGA